MAPLGQIAGIMTRYHQARVSLSALDQMMQTPVERPEGRNFLQRSDIQGHIEFRNVTFSYPDQESPALDDVSFRIEAGEKVGLIGRIGSGKSSIQRLVLGLYEPDKGAVMIDVTDVRQIDPADLRRSMGSVPQDVYLFFGSVKDNIAIGAPFTDDTSIRRAARITGVEEFVNRHPMGFDMPVGERGQTISGGQRQSIAIARALLRDPPILLLDEPTSAMDNTSESRFKARLSETLEDKTLLLVTHRGSMLSLVDRLIVVDGGKIVADGPKQDVLEALRSGPVPTAWS
jgi:ATP-binding cassette subfamily C protein LapB